MVTKQTSPGESTLKNMSMRPYVIPIEISKKIYI